MCSAYDKHGRCIIAVSEACWSRWPASVTSLKPSVEKDAHGNVQLSARERW